MTTIIGAIICLGLLALTIHSTLKVIGGPNGSKGYDNYIINFFTSVLNVAVQVFVGAEKQLVPIAQAITNAFTSNGNGIASQFRGPVSQFVKNEFQQVENALTSIGVSTPENAAQIAANTMAEAFGFGASAAAVTALFEAAFPEKLNTLNGVGPMISQMAGFEEITDMVREPLYSNAFGKSLEYYYRGIFKPELPDETDAVLWHARQLIDRKSVV